MAFCTKCGNQLATGVTVCPACGQEVGRRVKTMTKPREYTQPPPYSWAVSDSLPGANSPVPSPQYPQPLMQPQYVSPLANAGYKCPRCGSHNPPVIDSRISVAGWVVFATMIVTGICLPLCWIGLLMKEDYTVCPVCRCQLN